MASRNMDRLNSPFREKMLELQDQLSFEILYYCTGRSAWEQAKLYRQSRTKKVIDEKILILEKFGHEELAKILRDVGPQSGPHVTKAGPGESWHQYWEAVDGVPIIGGKPAWDVRKHAAQWRELGEKATALGVNWGGNWPKWADFPHFQMPPTGNPLKLGIPGCIMLESDL